MKKEEECSWGPPDSESAAVERERDVLEKALAIAQYERDEAIDELKRVCRGHSPNIIAERNQLLTDMKVAVVALQSAHEDVAATARLSPSVGEPKLSALVKALSTPSAKRILESEQNKEKETK